MQSQSLSTHLAQWFTSFCMPSEKDVFWLSDKPCMHHFFHFLVTGKITASQIVSEWINGDSQKEPDQNYVEDASTPQSSYGRGYQHCGQQCTDRHYRTTLRHLSTILLGIWLEYLLPTRPEAFHCNRHCTLLWPFFVAFQNWPLCNPKKCQHYISC
jgi:hypothetical protein